MAGKIKFPLKMPGDALVRSIEELREHFDLKTVLEYYSSGRLIDWLESRYYDVEAEKVKALDSSSADFKKCFCEIFDVPYSESNSDIVDMDQILKRNARRERLKQYTADDDILAAVDLVAFTQEEFVELLKTSDEQLIYLCGKKFIIPWRIDFEDSSNTPHYTSTGTLDEWDSYPKKRGFWTIWRTALYVNGTIRGINNPTVEFEGRQALELFMEVDFQNVDLDIGECIDTYADFSSAFERNPASGVKWLKVMADKGNKKAQYVLGKCYSEGFGGVETDYEEAVKWYQKAVNQGYAMAELQLGFCYYNGEGVEQDHDKAVKCFKRAAEQGNADAQYNLGCCLYNGIGIEQNCEEAAEWFRKSAEQGNKFSQYNIAECYYYGHGVDIDYVSAAEWLKKAAEQGYAKAQYKIGNCYYEGKGVKQDFNVAAEWYKKAAEQGYIEAQCRLGDCYCNGYGVDEDPEVAVKWYKKAAERGYAEAQYKLAHCYNFEIGVKYDFQEALKWYNKASDQGYEKATEAIQNEWNDEFLRRTEELGQSIEDICSIFEDMGSKKKNSLKNFFDFLF